jgi:tartrate dehydratase beta subunit/fumarate hydratase class I family protein
LFRTPSWTSKEDCRIDHCIKKVHVVDFPAIIIIDDKGNDFFKELNLG